MKKTNYLCPKCRAKLFAVKCARGHIDYYCSCGYRDIAKRD